MIKAVLHIQVALFLDMITRPLLTHSRQTADSIHNPRDICGNMREDGGITHAPQRRKREDARHDLLTQSDVITSQGATFISLH